MKNKNKIELVAIVVFIIVGSIAGELIISALSNTDAAEFTRNGGTISATKINIYKYTISLVPMTLAFTSYFLTKHYINKNSKNKKYS